MVRSSQGSRRRRRIILGVLITLGLILAVVASPVLYVRWVVWRGRATITKEAPGYWVAMPYPFFRNRVLIGMLIDPALQRRCNAAARDFNNALPQFRNSLAVVPLRIVNLGRVPYRHGLSSELLVGWGSGARAQETWPCRRTPGMRPLSPGAQFDRPSKLAPYVNDPRVRALLMAREQPAPARRTTDMVTVCQFVQGKSLDLGRVRVLMDIDPFGYELKPNFR